MSQQALTPLAPALDIGSTSIIMGSDDLLGSTGFLWNLRFQPGHAMTFGPTRKGGKGVSAIIPALLSYTGGSRLVIDPKGENYFAVKDQADRAGHRVVLMDPWNEANRRYGSKVGVNEPVTKYNPLSSLDPKSRDFADDVSAVADALIVMPDSSANRHFDDSARELVAGCVAAVVEQNPGKASLRDVRSILTQDATYLAVTLKRIVAANPNSLAGRKLRRFVPPVKINKKTGEEMPGTLTNEIASIRSTAETQTAFLDSETLLDAMETDEPPFDLAELATGKVSLFLVLPVDRLETHGRWMRLIITLAIRAIARQDTPPRNPVLFLLDEMGTIGRLSMVETAFGLMAGLGIRLWGFLQDLVQLQGLYPHTWETFISNSSVIQILKAHDVTTSTYVSNYLGNETVNAKTGSATYKQVQWAREGGRTVYDNLINKRVAEMEERNILPDQERGTTELASRNAIQRERWAADPLYLRISREVQVMNELKVQGKTRDYDTTWVPDEQLIGRPLLDPDEVRRLDNNRCLILLPGVGPLVQYRTIYYQHPVFAGLYRANPYFGVPATPSAAPATQTSGETSLP